jgi:hypothetical protein
MTTTRKLTIKAKNKFDNGHGNNSITTTTPRIMTMITITTTMDNKDK